MRSLLLVLVASTAIADDHVPTSLSFDATSDRGIAAGIGFGRRFQIGARTTYTGDGVGLFATAAVQHALNSRIEVGLRFGFGGTFTHEDPMLALRSPEEPSLTGLSFLTTTTLEGVVAVKLNNTVSLTLSGGPAKRLSSGTGWTGAIGIAVKAF